VNDCAVHASQPSRGPLAEARALHDIGERAALTVEGTGARDDGIAVIAGAGHLPPVVFAGDGSGELLALPVGPPLGTGVGGYQQVIRRLSPDDTLVMFTDGLVERRDEDIDESLARLAALRLPPGAGVDDLLDEVLVKLDARHAEDDVAVLAARIRPRNQPA
jgi:serine phosphatase RsbU (regulator of sigma subunit)